MRLFRALDAGLTAFVEELWPVAPAVFSDEWFESSSAPVSSNPPGVAGERPGLCEHSRAPEPGHPNYAVAEPSITCPGCGSWLQVSTTFYPANK